MADDMPPFGGYDDVQALTAERETTAFERWKLAIAGHDPRQADDAVAALTFAEAAEVVLAMHEPTWRSPNSGPTGEP